MAADPATARSALRERVIDLTRPYWLHLVAIALVSLLSVPLALLVPMPLKIVLDSVLGSEPLPQWLGFVTGVEPRAEVGIALAVGLLVSLALLSELQSLLSWSLQAYVSEHLLLRFRSQLFAHAQRLSMSYHDLRGSTDSTYRIQYDAPAIQNLAVNGLVPLATSAVTLAAMTFVMIRLDWQLASIAAAVVPILIWLTRRSSAELLDQWEMIKRSDSRSMSILQEVLGSLRVVKAFGQEEREQERFVNQSQQVATGHLRLARRQGSFNVGIGMTMALGSGAVLYVGALHVRSGLLSAGDLVLVTAYMGQLFGPVQSISKKFAQLQGAVAGLKRAFALLDEAPEVFERANARPIERSQGAITVRDLSFGYEADRRVLRHLTFDVPAGTRVGIAGRTGAGKTTLINLVTRMYDPTYGSILLDGIDLRDYKLADLRRQFGIVLQEPVLFSTTIGENIAYAKPEAAQDEIVAAARAANAHDFIEGLPQGYDTIVGERGFRLSGGERQRVSLARAFLKDAPILVLDEPTSSVDTGTESLIMEAMERLMRGRTTFMIAHRLTTLDSCDMRVVLEDGRLHQVTAELVASPN